MRRGLRLLVALSALALSLAVVAGAGARDGNGRGRGHYKSVCTEAATDVAHCNAQVATDDAAIPLVGPTPDPVALTPADFQSAYKLPSSVAGAGQTIAIVDAFDYPTAEADLATFSKQYALPACTTANGCFRKVNQSGGTNLRGYRADGGWSLEGALDLQTAHGICPNCKLIYVEAKTNSFANLSAAVDAAAALGANVISNSYGGAEFSSETSTTYDGHYNHPGVAITVSSGDSGYAVEYPAASRYVTAVGGTYLQRDSSPRGWAETAWSGAGSGCSAFEPKPAWQSAATLCARRAVADVAADADPASGASIYDSTPYNNSTGWWRVGGTSLASPLVAGVYALAGNAKAASYPVTYPWSNPNGLFDITGGSNGTCPTSAWCNAGPGWDGPTGLGSPNGTAGF
jgi:subtilase family serine protease